MWLHFEIIRSNGKLDCPTCPENRESHKIDENNLLVWCKTCDKKPWFLDEIELHRTNLAEYMDQAEQRKTDLERVLEELTYDNDKMAETIKKLTIEMCQVKNERDELKGWVNRLLKVKNEHVGVKGEVNKNEATAKESEIDHVEESWADAALIIEELDKENNLLKNKIIELRKENET